MKKKIFSIIAAFFVLTFVSACKDKTFEVNFDLAGGTGNIKTQIVKENNTAKKPNEIPIKEDNIFLGWYLDEEEFDFETVITKPITIEAKWEDVSYLKTLKYYEYLDINNPVITIEVEDYGIMKLELFPNVAENTVNNFINYVLENEYNGTIFHRVIKNFMIQGGAVRRPNSPIKGDFSNNGVENNLKHYRGVISMARTNEPNSATSQFFIVDMTSPHLDGLYAGFGGLISGFEVLDSIASVQTMYPIDRPLKDIVITKITVDLNGYEPKEVEYVK